MTTNTDTKPFAILTGNPNIYGSMCWELTGYTHMGDTPLDGIFLAVNLNTAMEPRSAKWAARRVLKQHGYRIVKWNRHGQTAQLAPIN